VILISLSFFCLKMLPIVILISLSFFCVDSAPQAGPDFNKTFQFDIELYTFAFDLFNFYRRQVFHGILLGQPKAKSMPYIFWDEGLAYKAREWSKKCSIEKDEPAVPIYGQSMNAESYAENLAAPDVNALRLKGLVINSFNKWFNQSENFVYPFDCRGLNSSCADYKQIVWARTTSFGCGLTQCKNFLQSGAEASNSTSSGANSTSSGANSMSSGATTSAASSASSAYSSASSSSAPASTSHSASSAGSNVSPAGAAAASNVTQSSVSNSTLSTMVPNVNSTSSNGTSNSGGAEYAYSFVCYFYPRGNVQGEKPYETE